jgi:AmiR/NasT family two-component response regulator
MRLRNQVIGALNLFTDERSGLSSEDVAIGQAMADVATIGLLHERTLREQTALSEQLQTALQSRILIEQAKGVLAARAAISVTEAFTQMRNHARRNRVALTAVATAIIEGTLDETILASS